MGEPAIELSNVSKRFTKYDDAPMLVTGVLHALRRSRRSDLWAVRNLDLRVEPGESVGIIGRNGSGKSTTMQMMCGVTAPTAGRVQVRGRVAPLIAVGVGFHPELTGRENIYVNGAILGLRRQEIDRKLDAIVDFAEIPDFLDTPVKFYSSGMFVRLGFAVAAHADPDVLLVDEVLAVGDFAFQIKCFEHMDSLRARGTTIVTVTHNLTALLRLCNRAVVLHQGEMVYDGAPDDAISVFHQKLAVTISGQRVEDGLVDLVESRVLDCAGSPVGFVQPGEPFAVEADVLAHARIDNPALSVQIQPESGPPVCIMHNLARPFAPLTPGERRTLRVRLGGSLGGGSYRVDVSVVRGTQGTADRSRLVDDIAVLAAPVSHMLRVAERPGSRGSVDMRPEFESDGG